MGGWIAACIISVCRGGLDFCRGFIVVVVATTLVFVPCGFWCWSCLCLCSDERSLRDLFEDVGRTEEVSGVMGIGKKEETMDGVD